MEKITGWLATVGPVAIVALTYGLRWLRKRLQKPEEPKKPLTVDEQEQVRQLVIQDAMQRATTAADKGEDQNATNRTQLDIDSKGEISGKGLPKGERAPGADKDCDISITNDMSLPPEGAHSRDIYLTRQRSLPKEDGSRELPDGVISRPMTKGETDIKVASFELYRQNLKVEADKAFEEALVEILADAEKFARETLVPRRQAEFAAEAQEKGLPVEVISEAYVLKVVEHARQEAKDRYDGTTLVNRLDGPQIRAKGFFQFDPAGKKTPSDKPLVLKTKSTLT